MKPILFNTQMVQAILEGRKTQTRRVVKDAYAYDIDVDGSLISKADAYGDHYLPQEWAQYKVGDILYVRETWGIGIQWAGGVIYRADYKDKPAPLADGEKWRLSIHMPKEAARLFLRVKSVRAERLQEISKEDIEKEGVSAQQVLLKVGYQRRGEVWSGWGYHFQQLWDSTIKPADSALYGWDANPWVFVYEFERISKEEVTK